MINQRVKLKPNGTEGLIMEGRSCCDLPYATETSDAMRLGSIRFLKAVYATLAGLLFSHETRHTLPHPAWAWAKGLGGPVAYSHSKLNSELSRDTVKGCRDRAAADLQEADTSTDPHQRKQLRWGAKRWSLRADMLERLAKSFRKRAALDEASRQYHRDKARHVTRP